MGYNICAVIFLYFCNGVQGASILALFSSLSFTDHLVFRGYASLLAQQGHSLVIMTPYPGRFQYPDQERIVELDVGSESGPFWDEYKQLVTNTDDLYPKMKALNELSVKLAIAQLRSKPVTALFVNPNLKFDLVITEADVPLLYAVAEKYHAPHIAITTSSGKIHQFESKGNPTHPILYPDVNSLNHGNLSYWQKLVELNRHLQTKLEYYNNYLPLCEVAAQKILGLKRSLLEVERDIDLLFIAGNPVLLGSRPTVPAITYVDRIQIKPGLTLPQDIQSTLDAANKGVIYFNLGAIQESEQLSNHMLQTLSRAFKELPYTVIWKIGNATMIEKANNIITQAWSPQQEILAHPNVKVFITHGGPRSLEEAVYYEVPIVGFPVVKSRKVFIEQITKFGAGVVLDPYYLDKDTIKAAIANVIGDEKYKLAISSLKGKVFDPILSGPENAVWWTEYVIRNGGARNLRVTASVWEPLTIYLLLDIIAYASLLVLLSLYLSYVILRYVFRRIRRRSTGQPDLGNSKFKAL